MSRRGFMESAAGAAAGASLAQTPSSAAPADDPAVLERRRKFLDILLQTFPRTTTNELTGRINQLDKNWEDWVKRTGELPPDFDTMPSIADLPDPLISGDGNRITTLEQWKERRQQIRAGFEHWVYGRMPPAPENVRALIRGSRREGGFSVRDARLEFGPEHRGILNVHLFIPDGKGPFPVFLTNQPRNSGWIYPALRRGYLACVYNATDPNYGVPDDSDKFIDVYPDYDFACIARWAWAGMRAVDYLCTLPEVDRKRIGITGHSRNSKQALVAAAFDERIGAVVASSGTTGECLPWRYTTDIFWGTGSIQSITGGPHNTHWFHPRLRFFAGREHKLPVDQNLLMSLVAPRGLIVCAAYSEHEGNHLGYEQAYRSVRQTYAFLGREENIWLNLRGGEHDFVPSGIEYFVNALDAVFGRRAYPTSETWISGYTFERWLKLSGETIDARPDPKVPAMTAVKNGIAWALGEEPPGLPFSSVNRIPAPERIFWVHPPTDSPLALLFGRPLKSAHMASTVLPFGDGLRGDLYFPAAASRTGNGAKLPIVIWLHPYSYATGYSRWVLPVFESLIGRGFAVLAFDQLGFGTRVLDARDFYDQYPKWSLMGRMVADTRAAMDAVSALEMIESSEIFLVGYALGGKVGLITGALDDRAAAVAAVCACDPLRAVGGDNETEGVRHYSHVHGLMPRLGFFLGKEARLPFDYDQVLASIAPRPVLLIAPTMDRYSPVDKVREVVERSRRLGRHALTFETPVDFNRFPRERQERIVDWLAALRR